MNRELKIMSNRLKDYLKAYPDNEDSINFFFPEIVKEHKKDNDYFCKRGDTIIRFQKNGTPYTPLQVVEIGGRMYILDLEEGYICNTGIKPNITGEVNINEFMQLLGNQSTHIDCFVVYGRIKLSTCLIENKLHGKIYITRRSDEYIKINY